MSEENNIQGLIKYIKEGCNFNGITELEQKDCIILTDIFQQNKQMREALEKIVQSKDCNCADVGTILNCIDCPDAFHNIAQQALNQAKEGKE